MRLQSIELETHRQMVKSLRATGDEKICIDSAASICNAETYSEAKVVIFM